MQLAAVQNNGWAIDYIKNPSPALFADTQVKHAIIKNILYLIIHNDFKSAKGMVTKLRKHGVAWPDLVHIEHSLNARKPG